MDSETRRTWAMASIVVSVVGCGTAPRFPLRDPLWKDDDKRSFAPAPKEYVSPFAWDGANQMVFRPISRFFAVDPAGRARNVNAMDEVPDSSWFTNRIGQAPMTVEALLRGGCEGKVLDPNMPDESWVIDQGKPNGANPGFRVNVPGYGKFMLKADPDDEPERATGATAIASRAYHAVGYFAPCDSVVYFRPSLLKLKPGLKVTDNSGVTKSFDAAALKALLARASRRDGLVRMGASKWLSGRPLGPYTYDGLRDDDPNDVIPHEDRRELRGGRLLAAWLNHFDSREQNSMDVFIADNPKDDASKGHVVHYILDLGDCFGSVWPWDDVSRRLGHAYYLDIPYVAEDMVTFGVVERPWERAQRTGRTFNYFSARDFDPEMWRGGYPNPAFVRMTEADGAWMARILARFSDAMIGAVVGVGQYEPEGATYLHETLIARRDTILKRYLAKLSPISHMRIAGDKLCGVDLARESGIVPDESYSYRARAFGAGALTAFEAAPRGSFCITLAHGQSARGGADDASRYTEVEIDNGYSEGVLRAHLYDLGGTAGFRLAGIERPTGDRWPR